MQRRDGWNYQYKIDTVFPAWDSAHPPHAAHRPAFGRLAQPGGPGKILLEEPDVLLMDEPTNYLDLEGLAWLEEWFNSFRGALIVVSHDRHFLDRVVNRIDRDRKLPLSGVLGRVHPVRPRKAAAHENAGAPVRARRRAARPGSRGNLRPAGGAAQPDQALKRKLANIKKKIKPRLVDKIITDIYQRLYVPSRPVPGGEHLSKSYDGSRSSAT